MRDKVQYCKEDPPHAYQCEKQKKASHVNTEGRDFQAKGVSSAKALR